MSKSSYKKLSLFDLAAARAKKGFSKADAQAGDLIEIIEKNSQDDNIDIISLKAIVNRDIPNKMSNIIGDINNFKNIISKIERKIKKIKRRQKTIIKYLLETNKKAYDMLEESMEVDKNNYYSCQY